MDTIEDLKNDLEVSKNVIRVLMKELLEAQKELKTLKVRTTSRKIGHRACI